MREITVPPLIERPELRSVCDLLDDRMRVDPEHVSFGRHLGGHLVDVTVSEFRDQATALAKGLAAAGVQPGDRVAIMSQTRYEWAVADFAIWAAG
ncbi:MAG: long-chain fatty acid--CoA ligase, partial [Rhodococcus sp.]|nr:long-chain fatty acid--CoA ligase [Rhodococcus sp. (in: high G+C Gram-positive bacteria)]